MQRLFKHMWFFIMFGFLSHSINAQETFQQSGYFWQRYYFKGRLNERFLLHVETERRSLETTRYTTASLLPRIHLHCLFKNHTDVGLGIAHFMNNQILKNEGKSVPVRSELRLNQVWSLHQPFGRVELSHRYQLEERLFFSSYNNEYLNRPQPFQYGFRFRYLFQIRARLTPDQKKVHVFLEFYDELLLQVAEYSPNQIFDANRFYGAVQVKFSPVWALEAGYLTWIQQNGAHSYSVPHILRITLQHNIDFRKEKTNEQPQR